MNTTIDSKTINKEIKNDIWPLLKDVGFSKLTSRTAWRLAEETIEVINFQSFNSYLADGIGCTTFSFAINLGVYYKCYELTPWFKPEQHIDLPQEYACHARKRLEKNINQAILFHPYNNPSGLFWEKDRMDIWYIVEDGSNIEEAINDAKHTVTTVGMDWLSKMKNIDHALQVFEQQVYKKSSTSWMDADIISALAIRLRNYKKAIKVYENILHSPYYQRVDNFEKNSKYRNKITIGDYINMANERITMLQSKFTS